MLATHQHIHVKARVPVCGGAGTHTASDCVSREALQSHKTLQAQRAHLGASVCDMAFRHAKSHAKTHNDGCSSAENCGYTLSKPVSLNSAGTHAHVSCQKMLHDTSNKKKCCMGELTGTSCQNGWTPLDPDAECLTYVRQGCCGTAKNCTRHKFLSDAQQSQDPQAFMCGLWYMGNINAYMPSSNHLQPQNDQHHKQKKAVAYALIHCYCGNRPETGECSCIKAWNLCQCRQNGGNCGIYGDPTRHFGRRFEIYKTVTDQNGTSTFKPVTPGSTAFQDMPVHCWSRACQYANHCGFFPENDLSKKCPNTCMQFSSNSTINLTNISGYKELALNSLMMRCVGSNAPQDKEKVDKPLQFNTGHIIDKAVPDTWVSQYRGSFKLHNKACDSVIKSHGKRWFCISSSAPKIAWCTPRRGCLVTKESQTVKLYLNTAGLTQGQYTVQFIVQDVCDGSKPFAILYSLTVMRNIPKGVTVPPTACFQGNCN